MTMFKGDKRREMRKVLTVGVYDLLHWGHFELFRRAKELAGPEGKLVVAVQKDEWVTKFKDVKLVYDWSVRAKMISALRYVDEVVSYTSIDESIKEIDFTVFVTGQDQNHAGFQSAQKWCKEHGREVVMLPRTEGVSSSMLRNGNLK